MQYTQVKEPFYVYLFLPVNAECYDQKQHYLHHNAANNSCPETLLVMYCCRDISIY
jgi:hypothetical protein